MPVFLSFLPDGHFCADEANEKAMARKRRRIYVLLRMHQDYGEYR
jgi:hypothetical protein